MVLSRTNIRDAGSHADSGITRTSSRMARVGAITRVLLLIAAVAAIWSQVKLVTADSFLRCLSSYTVLPIAVGIALTVASFAVLASTELFALQQVGSAATSAISRMRGATTGFIASAFGQAMGFSLLTGAAVRLRAYDRHGITPTDVTRLSTFTTVTATLGLLAIGAVSLLVGSESLVLSGYEFRLHWIGVGLAVITAIYLAWCGLPGGRRIGPRRWHARRPGARVALGQLAISSLDWVLAASVLFVLLPHGMASYPHFLPAYFVAQAIAVVSHVPAGLGVFEAVLLGVLVPGATGLDPVATAAALAAALLLYRLIYYAMPLVTAAGVAAVNEIAAKRRVELSRPAVTTTYQEEDLSPPGYVDDPAPDCVEWLIDNSDAYQAIVASVGAATTSISIAQLALDPDFAVQSGFAHDIPATPFIELLANVSRDKGVAVKVLLNSTLLLDTLKPLRRFMRKNRIESPRIELRGVSRFPQLLHAKFVIVDSETAFLVGSPFVNGYWDSPLHRPFESSRPMGELGGRPLHDVSLRIRGPAVQELDEFFDVLWMDGVRKDAAENSGGKRFIPSRSRCVTRPRRILRSIPKGTPDSVEGCVEILDELLPALNNARSLIYIEHQYLSSRPVLQALRDALDREPGLEIILVLNQNPDVTAYARWQTVGLREFELIDHPRVGLFALWSIARSETSGHDINQVFVHTKVIVIDDTWAMCGSANLDGVSLHSYGDDFLGVIGRRVFRDIRNFDAAIVVRGTESDLDESKARTLRRCLWREHLGSSADAGADRPAAGWLEVWRAAARRNVLRVNSGDGMAAGAFVLPFSTSRKPSVQLADCGVEASGGSLNILFNPGWVERQFSPRWMRNMFL